MYSWHRQYNEYNPNYINHVQNDNVDFLAHIHIHIHWRIQMVWCG